MLTTVTSTTADALSTAAAASFTLIAILTLILLLIRKELSGATENERAARLGRAVNLAIIPLAIVFLASVIAQLVTALR